MKKKSRTPLGLALVASCLFGFFGLGQALAAPSAPMAGPPLAPAPQGTLYVEVQPCRVLDTRLMSGPLSGTSVTFDASGDLTPQGGSASCGIPEDATAIAVNLTGITTTSTGGFLRGWPAGSPQPNATLLNYSTAIHASNMVNIPLGTGPCTGCGAQFKLRNWGGNVHVVGDVVGYYTRPPFAQVTGAGALVAGSSHVMSSSRLSAGVYQLIFDRDMTRCAFTVNVRNSPRLITAALSPSNPDMLMVVVRDPGNTPQDSEFDVSATC